MSRALDRLRTSFVKADREYAPLALWFWNGRLHEAELGRQIKEFADKGIGGVFLHARESLQTPYFEERWWDAVDFAVRKGREAGLKTWIYDEYAWPSGPAGSPGGRNGQTQSAVLSQGSQHFAKTLTRMIHEVEGPAEVALEGRYPAGNRLVQVAARLDAEGDLDPETLVDVTKETTWECPEGTWRVLSFSVRTIEDRIDYLRPATVKAFLDAAYERYAERHKGDFGDAIPGVFFDEPYISAEPMPWTDDLPERFRQRTGYDLLTSLPLLVLRGGSSTVSVRCDFYETVAALYEEAWFAQMGDWCRRHGLEWTGHTEEHVASHPARQGNYFRGMRHLTIPGSDHHGFRYSRPRTVQAAEVKPAVSVAAMAGRDRVMAEAFGGAGWGLTLDELRHGANLLAAYGVNMQVLHGLFYSMATAEAADDWPPSLGHQNPYWPNFKGMSDYIARLSAVIGHSRSASTVGVLYPWTSIAANTADGRPNARAQAIAEAYEGLIDGLSDASIDVQIVDERFISHGQARLENGRLRQGALTITTLILPPTPVISPQAMRRLGAFVRSGGDLIVMGERPSGSSEGGWRHRPITRAVGTLFGAASSTVEGAVVGKGRTHQVPEELPDAIERIAAILSPGTTVDSDADVIAVPRRLDGAEVLFIVNRSAANTTATIATDVPGRPEVWNPETGETEALSIAGSRGKRRFKLDLLPHAARAVVFDTSVRASRTRVPRPKKVEAKELEFKTDWTFALDGGTPTGQGSIRRSELPVMRVASFKLGAGRLEQLRDPAFDDSEWPETWLARAGADTVGNWRASWITGVRKHGGWAVKRTSDQHRRLRFRRTLELTEPPIKAWATFVGVDRVTVYMNGTQLGESEDWSSPVTYNIMPYLRPGQNTIVADVECVSDAPISFLFEGQIDLRSGGSIVIVSDESWDVQAPPTEVWSGLDFERDTPLVTWERGRPPVEPWRHIPLLGEPVAFPRTVVYRQRLPVGCVGIGIPNIKGTHKVYVDVRERTPDIQGIYNITTGRLLTVEIEAADFSNGILAPLALFTRPTTIALQPWANFGFGWFSGTGTYERSFELTAEQANSTITLDLGDVRHHAEVFVNNRRVDVRLWSPYRFDLSGFVQTGSNSLRVRVSNLYANEMRWKRDETKMGNPWHRYWHEDNIEAESLVSGLLGPVQLRVS
ncbi:MAG: glycosyl hydrolase [Chloroflexi bacterium]|nr:glycosyl hydrolase [Chloroflexota bacterium]